MAALVKIDKVENPTSPHSWRVVFKGLPDDCLRSVRGLGTYLIGQRFYIVTMEYHCAERTENPHEGFLTAVLYPVGL